MARWDVAGLRPLHVPETRIVRGVRDSSASRARLGGRIPYSNLDQPVARDLLCRRGARSCACARTTTTHIYRVELVAAQEATWVASEHKKNKCTCAQRKRGGRGPFAVKKNRTAHRTDLRARPRVTA